MRAQLRVPADDALESALAKATESRPVSLQSFIEAFLNAYEDANPEKPAALAFTQLDLSNDALVSFLQRRFAQIGEEGVLPRVYLTTAAAMGPCGVHGGPAAITGRKNAPEMIACVHYRGFQSWDSAIVPLRTLTSALSLGP